MRKIRIGTDIRLKLKISPNTEAGFDKIDEFDLSNVKQLKCYIINTSWMKPPKDGKPAPFKRVGFPEFFRPDAHNINNAGYPSYYMEPANVRNYDRFIPDFHDYHWWPGYRGFGLRPERFHDWCPHVHHGPHPHPCPIDPFNPRMHHPYYEMIDPVVSQPGHPGVPPCEEPFHPFNEPYDIFMKPMADHSHQSPWNHYYLADSLVLHETNALTCMFPAIQLIACGTYKLVIVLTVFEQGWGRHNLRTYTIDKGDVFELVNDETGESGNIFIDVDDSGERECIYQSIYTATDHYIMASDTKMMVGEMDTVGLDYNIYIKLKDGTTLLYNPFDWRYPELKFKSSDENVVTVDNYGTLYAHNIEEAEKEVTITVTDIDNNVSWDFYVTVRQLDTLLIGFDPTEDINAMSSTSDTLDRYSTKQKTYVINNSHDGYYMWVFSQRRIHYIKSTEDGNELAAELSSGFRVPMTNAVIKDGYFCYRSVSPILADDIRIKIKFAG